jgi:pimeloyl-ACP methyl ester carboxylesterase
MPLYSAPIPGLVSRDHWIDAPLDHSEPDGETIRVYAREVVATESADKPLPWLLFLQGGPGGKASRFTGRSSWLDEALKHYRVLLLDQRGTGRSTPVTDRTAARFGDDAAGLATYLACFRQDAIVRDAELLRRELIGATPWCTLGQSYGGFITFAYLSHAPQALDHCLVTGGIPGIDAGPDDVYRRTWPRVLAKNAEYRRRFPEDDAVLDRLREMITSRPADDPVRLPGGDPFTVNRLQALGHGFGFGDGYAKLHLLLEEAFAGDHITPFFLDAVEQQTHHRAEPLYAILQEVIYCSGPGVAANWSAERIRTEFPEAAPDADRLILIGEMKESWVFREEAFLRPFAAAMEILAARADWPVLYDLDRLAANEVTVAAAMYFDDLYVDAELSLRTAAATPHVRTWVTNQYEHDGLRTGNVLARLRELATGLA